MLIQLIIICLVMGLVFYLLQMLPIAEPFKTIVLVASIVVAIIYLLRFLPGAGGGTPALF